MLPDRYCQLLTAFVDGQLGKRQRKLVARLLRKSPEARLLLQQLQDNAHQLKTLPVQTLGPDFPSEVLSAIKKMQPATVPLQRTFPRRGFPTWLSVAAAAAVLAMVTGVSYWFFSPNQETTGPVVQIKTTKQHSPPAKHQHPARPPQLAKNVKKPAGKGHPAPMLLAFHDLAQ